MISGSFNTVLFSFTHYHIENMACKTSHTSENTEFQMKVLYPQSSQLKHLFMLCWFWNIQRCKAFDLIICMYSHNSDTTRWSCSDWLKMDAKKVGNVAVNVWCVSIRLKNMERQQLSNFVTLSYWTRWGYSTLGVFPNSNLMSRLHSVRSLTSPVMTSMQSWQGYVFVG